MYLIRPVLAWITLMIFAGMLSGTASDSLRARAASGDADAAFRLAMMYYAGTPDCPRNPPVAVYWFRKAADAGSIPSRYNLGLCYEFGIGIEKSRIQAYREYETASGAGLLQARLRCAIMLRTGLPEEHTAERTTPGIKADPVRAMELFQELADDGLADARRYLAEMLLNPPPELRMPPDAARAVPHLQKAAAAGNSAAQKLLADCYLAGNGIAADPQKARQLLQQAAEHGNADAMSRLGDMLEYGIGIMPDEAAAYQWFKKAADRGIPRGRAKLGDFYWSGKFVRQDVIAAAKLYQQAADAGDAYGAFRLACCCMDGIGVRRDPAKGLQLLQKAARDGEAQAQYRLAMLYRQGIQIPQDEGAAVYWFSRAAAIHHPAAMREYGKCMLAGGGGENEQRGRAWIIRAAKAGDTEARKIMQREKFNDAR